MILVDSSVWIDHLRRGDDELSARLDRGQVLRHPFIIGELALGSMRQRDAILSALRDLPVASVASDLEMLGFIERHALHGHPLHRRAPSGRVPAVTGNGTLDAR